MDFIKEKQIIFNHIQKGTFPKDYAEWGGADLIITSDSSVKGRSTDLVVYTDHASPYSWLLTELYRIYSTKIHYLNKYEFIGEFGEIIQNEIKKETDLFTSMEDVYHYIVTKWDSEAEKSIKDNLTEKEEDGDVKC